jgi:predicted TPR repeat methyltransferase
MEVQPDLVAFAQSSGDLLADRRYEFAIDLAARGDRHAALDLLVQAVEIAPRFASAWFALGGLREQLGDQPGAIFAYRQAQAADPDDRRGAGLHLMRLGAQRAGAMPTGYVRSLFDQYAPRFDAARANLGYRGPELLLTAICKHCEARSKQLRFGAVLDLGCGTGLAGAAIRPVCDRLVGVDLAPGMVAVARGKGLYDRLEVGDIEAFLAAERASAAHYHLILVADVLPYVSNLVPVTAAAAALLGPGALLALTVETHAGAGSVLGDKLRYAHSEAHVREALSAAGLPIQVLERAATRHEANAPVPSLIVIAGRDKALDPAFAGR